MRLILYLVEAAGLSSKLSFDILVAGEDTAMVSLLETFACRIDSSVTLLSSQNWLSTGYAD